MKKIVYWFLFLAMTSLPQQVFAADSLHLPLTEFDKEHLLDKTYFDESSYFLRLDTLPSLPIKVAATCCQDKWVAINVSLYAKNIDTLITQNWDAKAHFKLNAIAGNIITSTDSAWLNILGDSINQKTSANYLLSEKYDHSKYEFELEIDSLSSTHIDLKNLYVVVTFYPYKGIVLPSQMATFTSTTAAEINITQNKKEGTILISNVADLNNNGAIFNEIEWVYYDEYYNQINAIAKPFDRKGSLNAIVPLHHTNEQNLIYKILNHYKKGKLYVRRRFATPHPLNQEVLLYSPWSTEKYTAIASDFNEQKTWQRVTSYAEEGKSKSVVTYFDDSYRARQTLTQIENENKKTTLIAENLYDVEGRAVGQILPAPLNDTTSKLNFQEGFNQFPNQTHISNSVAAKAYYEGEEQQALSTKHGSGQYYSKNNPEVKDNEIIQRIPDAAGYTYSLQKYENNHLQRAIKSGGVGSTFKISNTSKNTQYFYGDVKKSELIRLFGDDGNYWSDISKYQKVMTIDPNGQASVSYLNAQGQVIATALAGTCPANLDSLSSFVRANLVAIDLPITSLQQTSGGWEIAQKAMHLNSSAGSGLQFEDKDLSIDAFDVTGIKNLIDNQYQQVDTILFKPKITQEWTISEKEVLLKTSQDSSLNMINVGSYGVGRNISIKDSAFSEPFTKYLSDLEPFIDNYIQQKVNSILAEDSVTIFQEKTIDLLDIDNFDTLFSRAQQQSTCQDYIELEDCSSAYDCQGDSINRLYQNLMTSLKPNSLATFESNLNDWLGKVQLSSQITEKNDPLLMLVQADPLFINHSNAKDELLDSLGYNNGDSSAWAKLADEYPDVADFQDKLKAGVYIYFQRKLQVREDKQNIEKCYANSPARDSVEVVKEKEVDENGNIIASIENHFYHDSTDNSTVRNDAHIRVAFNIERFYQNMDSIAVFTPNELEKDLYAFGFQPFSNDTTKSNIEIKLDSSNLSLQDFTLDLVVDINHQSPHAEVIFSNLHLYNDSLPNQRYFELLYLGANQSYDATHSTLMFRTSKRNAHIIPLPSGFKGRFFMVKKGQQLTFYFDEESHTINLAPNASFSFSNIYFGKENQTFDSDSLTEFLDQNHIWSNHPFTGKIGEFRIWAQAFAADSLPKASLDIYLSKRSEHLVAGWNMSLATAQKSQSQYQLFNDAADSLNWKMQVSPALPAHQMITGMGFKLPMRYVDFQMDFTLKGDSLNAVDSLAFDFWNFYYEGDAQTRADRINLKVNELQLEVRRQELIREERARIQKIIDAFALRAKQTFVSKARQNLHSTPVINSGTGEYHYTLYYYDLAGNLVQTVPPAGVKTNNQGKHKDVTQYAYNTLGQLVWQKTPDAGITEFVYDHQEKLRFSINHQQKNHHQFSYTKYDYLGRVIESGQAALNGITINQLAAYSNIPQFPFAETDSIFLSNRVFTYYGDYQKDSIYSVLGDSLPTDFDAKNLRNRVAYTIAENSNQPNDSTHLVASFYQYDLHGNVSKLLQYNPIVGFKTIAYDYDLLSGNVKMVQFQPNTKELFAHKYQYDSDNRLQKVYTSNDLTNWSQDALYIYYPHGPLATIELGENNLQKIDYFYTLQGWIKGVNLPTGDSLGLEQGHFKAQDDIYAYALSYFENDYKPIGHKIPNAISQPVGSKALYNGNIASMFTAIKKPTDEVDSNPFIQFNYTYDQLNRITSSQSKKAIGNSFVANSNTQINEKTLPFTWHKNALATSYQYDPNGNLTKLSRHDIFGEIKDSLVYHYQSGYTNRLGYVNDHAAYKGLQFLPKNQNNGPPQTATFTVNDSINHSAYTQANFAKGNFIGSDSSSYYIQKLPRKPANDFQNQQAGNYQYDSIGNLIADASERIRIQWNVQGKVAQVIHYDSLEFTQTSNQQPLRDSLATGWVQYYYDATGNRSSKIVYKKDSLDQLQSQITTYLRDASGNIMAIYQDSLLSELNLFGSSRLGTYHYQDSLQHHQSFGQRNYELSNHLGNVMAVISDRIISPDTLRGDAPELLSATDYHPFGLTIAGRAYNKSNYRFGFNGKENDTDFGKDQLIQDYGFRLYNPSIARFLSVDPLTREYPHYTPYQFSGNKPIIARDLDGLEEDVVVKKQYQSRNRPIVEALTAARVAEEVITKTPYWRVLLGTVGRLAIRYGTVLSLATLKGDSGPTQQDIDEENLQLYESYAQDGILKEHEVQDYMDLLWKLRGIDLKSKKFPTSEKEGYKYMLINAKRYQEHVTGVSGDLEYNRNGVGFDGYRNNTLLEAKYGYGKAFNKDGSVAKGEKARSMADHLLKQAQRQVEQLKDGETLEWHFNNEQAAKGAERLFEENGLDEIEVIHDPMTKKE